MSKAESQQEDIAHVTFSAAFVPGQCIKLVGDGGARITMDIPETDVGAVDTLRHWRNMILMVTVVPVREGSIESDDSTDCAPSRTTAKRRVV